MGGAGSLERVPEMVGWMASAASWVRWLEPPMLEICTG